MSKDPIFSRTISDEPRYEWEDMLRNECSLEGKRSYLLLGVSPYRMMISKEQAEWLGQLLLYYSQNEVLPAPKNYVACGDLLNEV